MRAVVVGCGRVGSKVALQLADEGWDVSVVDAKEEALVRLGEAWRGGFVVGHGMDTEILLRAGIDGADAVVVATNGDNTNLVIAQVAQRRFEVNCVVARILDPARAQFFAGQGLRTICPTQSAIDDLTEVVRTCTAPLETTGA
jgi:trk system potassium uptake protein TrkA